MLLVLIVDDVRVEAYLEMVPQDGVELGSELPAGLLTRKARTRSR